MQTRKSKLIFLITNRPDTRPFTKITVLRGPIQTSLRSIIGTHGGDGRNRTDDPLLAKQVLYQLSYIPN